MHVTRYNRARTGWSPFPLGHGLITRRSVEPPAHPNRAGGSAVGSPVMADIRTVDGLDVRPGQLLRHPSGVVVKVTGAARKKVGRNIVNVVQVERTDNGQRGYLELREGQRFTVGAGLKHDRSPATFGDTRDADEIAAGQIASARKLAEGDPAKLAALDAEERKRRGRKS